MYEYGIMSFAHPYPSSLPFRTSKERSLALKHSSLTMYPSIESCLVALCACTCYFISNGLSMWDRVPYLSWYHSSTMPTVPHHVSHATRHDHCSSSSYSQSSCSVGRRRGCSRCLGYGPASRTTRRGPLIMPHKLEVRSTCPYTIFRRRVGFG